VRCRGAATQKNRRVRFREKGGTELEANEAGFWGITTRFPQADFRARRRTAALNS
jgi:hypothetical protein